MVTVLDSGKRGTWVLRVGRTGSDPDPSPVLWPRNIPCEPLHCSLMRKECSENKVIALQNFILGYTLIWQLVISWRFKQITIAIGLQLSVWDPNRQFLAYLRVPDLGCMVMENDMRNFIIGYNRKNLIMRITYLANCKFRHHISIQQFSTCSRQYNMLSTNKKTAFQSSRQNTDTTTYR